MVDVRGESGNTVWKGFAEIYLQANERHRLDQEAEEFHAVTNFSARVRALH